jgi:hypothetical protein
LFTLYSLRTLSAMSCNKKVSLSIDIPFLLLVAIVSIL